MADVEGRWVTINGAKVFISNKGDIIMGLGKDEGNTEAKPPKRVSHLDEAEFFASLGYSEEQEETLLDALVEFTGEGSTEARERGYSSKGDTLEVLDKAIEDSNAKFNDDRMSLYRGIRAKENAPLYSYIMDLKPGDVIDQMGTSSWSTSSRVASAFAASSNEKGFMFRDETKGVRNALSIAGVSNVKEEKEVMYSGKTKWKVKALQQCQYTHEYTLEDIDVWEILVEEVKG